MAAVALDLSPTVDVLVEHPFDSTALQRAHAAVKGHPQAYATALRCAAKRTDDPLAAAYWLIEAARVHESVDDLGGAIALLSRAWEFDQANARTRELLAGCMARLSIRVGLGFTASAPPVSAIPVTRADARPAPVESGLRPPPMDSNEDLTRDTLPGLFGLELLGGEEKTFVEQGSDEVPSSLPSEPEQSGPDTEVAPPSSESVLRAVADLATGAAAPKSEAPADARKRRDALFPPPPGPDPGSEPSAAPIPLSLARPRIDESALAVAEDLGTPTLRSSGTALAKAPAPAPSIEAPAEVPSEPVAELPNEDAYVDGNRIPTVRPGGDGLVGVVFEALHELHFLNDVREGARFVGRLIEAKMQPAIALVHLYDINSRHFVVMSALGSRKEVLLEYATPDDDPLASEIMKSDEAILVLDPASDPRLSRGRWRLAEPKKSVLCAPVAVDGRYLGLLEIADPTDGSEFTEEDRNVLTYIATAFAQYLNGKGVVLGGDPELNSAIAW